MDRIRPDVTDPWSVTTGDLREHLRTLRAEMQPAAVVTIADVEGTAYRRPGAKMVVDTDAEMIGAVTAGCLEERVIELSADVLEVGKSRVAVFDMMEDDGDTWGLGLGCNGILDVLLEPLDASWDRALSQLAAGVPVTLLTVLGSTHASIEVGDRSVFEDTEFRDVPDRRPLSDQIQDEVRDVVENVHGTGKTVTAQIGTEDGAVDVLIDGLKPVNTLLLFGSQGDIHPVSRLGSMVGFDVTVHSPRGAQDEDAFPHADKVVTGHPTAIAESVGVDEDTYAVIMSHNLLDDQLAIETLLEETAVPYIGLMGPRERFESVREGSEVIAGDGLDRVATPVGLDLGGGAPTEIALSIVGEVLAVSNDRDGGRLKATKGPIHQRIVNPDE